MADVIKSYLVSLSATTDKASFDKFTSAMMGAEKTVSASVGGIVGKFLMFETAGIAAFASVGFGIVAYIDKLADADLKTKLLATQNMMSVQQYRAVSMALDTLGVSLNDVFFGTKELQERFHLLIDDQKQLVKMLGPGYEKQQEMVRDVIFQLQRLEVKGQYFGMAFAADLLEKLGFGKGGIVLQLERLNDFVVANMPHWADVLSTDVIPYFSDLWNLLKDLGVVAKQFEVGFVHLMGELSGNDALRNSKGDFSDLATSIGIAAHEFSVILEILPRIATILPPLAEQLVDTLTGVAEFASGHPFKAKADFDRARSAGDNVTAQMQGLKDWFASNPFAYNRPGSNSEFLGLVQGTPQANAVQIARDVSAQTRIPAALIYGQMGFETGGFKTFAGQNNFSGIKVPGTDSFQNFQSILDFERSYSATLNSRRYVENNIRQAHDAYSFASALRTPSGSYYGKDSEANYGAGVDRYAREFGAITIGSITVHSAPNLTPDQHAHAIKKGVKDAMDEGVREMIVAMNGAYY